LGVAFQLLWWVPTALMLAALARVWGDPAVGHPLCATLLLAAICGSALVPILVSWAPASTTRLVRCQHAVRRRLAASTGHLFWEAAALVWRDDHRPTFVALRLLTCLWQCAGLLSCVIAWGLYLSGPLAGAVDAGEDGGSSAEDVRYLMAASTCALLPSAFLAVYDASTLVAACKSDGRHVGFCDRLIDLERRRFHARFRHALRDQEWGAPSDPGRPGAGAAEAHRSAQLAARAACSCGTRLAAGAACSCGTRLAARATCFCGTRLAAGAACSCGARGAPPPLSSAGASFSSAEARALDLFAPPSHAVVGFSRPARLSSERPPLPAALGPPIALVDLASSESESLAAQNQPLEPFAPSPNPTQEPFAPSLLMTGVRGPSAAPLSGAAALGGPSAAACSGGEADMSPRGVDSLHVEPPSSPPSAGPASSRDSAGSASSPGSDDTTWHASSPAQGRVRVARITAAGASVGGPPLPGDGLARSLESAADLSLATPPRD
jgi:hypothetical protein